ncbi:hypothetical protein LWI28_001786 [Acer negundo]|uniref:Uncharacterized protein n=1 Tax=Acer negundo TaxID=4023 RepID=A0AAD5ISU1_ACENE|nr:hypothetical protein LWI28_001786 [Acer negundo]
MASIGHDLTIRDRIFALVNGLDRDYKVVMVNITSLGLSYTFDEVCSLLLTHERRLEQYGHVINTDGTIPSANMAYHVLEADLNRVFASENSNVSEDYDGDEQSGSE